MTIRSKLKAKLGMRRSSSQQKADLKSSSSRASLAPESSSTPSVVKQPLSRSGTLASTITTQSVKLLSEPSPPPSIAQDFWFDALGKLSDDHQQVIRAMQPERKAISPLSESMEELVGATKRKQQDCEAKSYKFSFLGRELILRGVAEKTIFWLNKFKSIGDIAVGFDQVHASLPWAGIRFMLQAAVAESEQMGALLVAVEKVTYLVNRCAVYESLYPSGVTPQNALQNFHVALVEIYAATLRLIALSHTLLCKSTPTRALHALVNPQEVLESVKECEDLERRVEIEAQNCERILSKGSREVDVNTQKLLEILKTPILRSDENVSSLLAMVSDEERFMIFDWVSGVLCGKNHDTKDTSSSAILWLYGTPGTGKTFLTSRAIDEIRRTLKVHPNHEGFAFFYCNRNEFERRQPLPILRSFVRQLSSTMNNQHSIQKRVRDYYIQGRQEASELTITKCRELLHEFITIYSKTTLVLDALDECEQASRSVLIEVFVHLLSQATRPVKIFISSGPEIDIRDRFEHHCNIGIRATDNHDDISSFVKSESTRHPRWNNMSPELRDGIIETIQQQSQGMFQWAYLQIKQILVLQQEKPIRVRLGKLPSDLKHAYDEIFNGMDEVEREVAGRAFQWIMCACSPLSSDELLPAVCQVGDGTLQDTDDLDEDILLKYCHNLLIIDPTRGVWVPSHLSVIEYCETHLWSQLQANCFVASVCLSLLNNNPLYDVYEDDENAAENFLSPSHESFNFYFYVAHHWMFHVRRCEDWEDGSRRLSHMLERFFGSPTQSAPAYRQWMRFLEYDMSSMAMEKASPSLFFGSPFHIKDLDPHTPAFAICALGLYTTLPNWWIDP
ncbi:hypothetical protein AJ79_02962 [Helicocarpus griseus UAMH5409]|uniref:Uncharacterized protein n=1 Tax=Helicocarpus griseus UAMH5409 TaxID=1447875 RepID=A0A2B7Y1N8_9EURO|nr:hypothetical protein AJ79_02962 [Helicocarpus griseus UAMH5409]